MTHGSESVHVVQRGESLSEIWLDTHGDKAYMLKVIEALTDLQRSEDGGEKLKSFGIRSGDIDLLYPEDEVKISAIQDWFAGYIKPDLIIFIEDGEVVERFDPAEGDLESGGVEEMPSEEIAPEEVPDDASEEEAPLEGASEEVISEGASEEEPLEETPVEDLPEEVILEDAPENPLPNDDLAQQIHEIAEDSRSRELDLGFNATYELGYSNHGIDTMVLEQFFQGHIVSQGISISHSSGFLFSLENLVSAEGGAFSDLGDRTNLSVGFRGGLGSFYGMLQHQWVHTNHLMEQNFFYADRHRTSLQIGFSLGPLEPYAFVLSDVPAYTPVDEMMVYGGGGLAMTLPIDPLNTEITVGASFTGSLFWYYRKRQALYRVHAGFATQIGGISLRPEVTYLADTFTGKSVINHSVKIIF